MSAPGTYTPPPQAGWSPLPFVPIFSAGEDWITSLVPSDVTFTWPPGTTVTAQCFAPPTGLVPGGPPYPNPPLFTWPGEIQPDQGVYFKAEAADTDTVPASSIVRIMVSYPSSPDGVDDDYCWCQGKVSRRDGT